MFSLNLQAKQCMQTTWHTHFVELTTVPKNFFFFENTKNLVKMLLVNIVWITISASGMF